MRINRRSFSRAFLGAAPAFGAWQAAAQAPAAHSGSYFDRNTFDFWSRQAGAARARASSRGLGEVDRQAQFLLYTQSGLVNPQPHDFPVQHLIEAPNAAIEMQVLGFRPGRNDRQHFENLKSAHLRLDLGQQHSIWASLLDPLTWTAFAAIFPSRRGKLPKLQSMNFDPASSWRNKKILLPNGRGSWNLNFFVQDRESFFCRLLGLAGQEAARFAPVLGLPGITTDALHAFNVFYGGVQARAHTHWLFQSSAVEIAATRDAASLLAAGGSAILLTSGVYVVVPQDQYDLIHRHRKDLWLQFGYILPQKESFTAELVQRTLPDITYLTLSVAVKPATLPSVSV